MPIFSDRGIHALPVMEDGFAVIRSMVWPPFECPVCHRMTAMVITRWVKHHCPECDEKYRLELKAKKEAKA